MSDRILEVDSLSGGYGDTIVLRDIGFSVDKGEVLGVLGRNGAGKTTLMRLLTGRLPIAGGRIEFAGQSLQGMPPFARARLGMSYSPQENIVVDGLNLRENLTLTNSDIGRCSPYFKSFPRIEERLTQRAATLSGGEKKMLTFVRTLAENQPLTLLDEPTEGVQQENLERMAGHIQTRTSAGGAFIVVEQNLSFLLSITDRVLVIDHGVVVSHSKGASRSELSKFLAV